MSELPKHFNSQEVEKKWQAYWLDNKTYKWQEKADRKDNFVIDTPPPTVSGLLHMGHIYSYTQADIIARYKRMQGFGVFYPMGFDDNGLPTERLVEKVKKIRAVTMDRAEFVEICKDVVKEAEDEFRTLFREVGLSVDWDEEYQTISDRTKTLSQMSFLDLFQKGHIYRKMQPNLFDPADRTALAQAEITDLEMKGVMNNVEFSTIKGEKFTIATTRPELIPACVAVFCHPEDARHKHLIGQTARTALFEVEVPILADSTVDMEKGTGIVMCCTFGDQHDIEWWRVHNLPLRVILDKTGRLNNFEGFGSSDWPSANKEQGELYISQIIGQTVKVAREKIIELLREEGKLLAQQDIMQNVKTAERSGAPLEILVTPQWFVKVLDKKKELLEKSAQCNWYPAYMKVRMDNWIEGLNWDWCISRQRFFGVPFPAWYSKRAGEEGKILLADIDQLPVDPLKDLPKGYSRDEVEPDFDVMDTWATSSISPQLSSLAINKDFALDYARHQKLFPADMRPQAHEIIRTWAFSTLVKAHLHENTIPWHNLMISGWCLAADKTKMSKSKGNVVTPNELLVSKGADVVRYWTSTSRLGADTAYSEDVLDIGKKLVNKLWNASKFVNIHLQKLTAQPAPLNELVASGAVFEKLDLWVLSRLHEVIAKATEELDRFEYCIARTYIEEFFWKDFCDNYLELVKTRAYDEAGTNPKGQLSAIYTLFYCLNYITKLFAPYLPYITEELYSNIFETEFAKTKTIHSEKLWPKAADLPFDQEALMLGKTAVYVLDTVRFFKAQKQVSIKTPLQLLVVANKNYTTLAGIENDLRSVTNSNELRLGAIDSLEDAHFATEDGETKVNIYLDEAEG